jgi:hypothetical protein
MDLRQKRLARGVLRGGWTRVVLARDVLALLALCLALTIAEASAAAPAPTVLGTVPTPPATNTAPDVYGTAEAGSTVGIFTNAACSGAPLATGSASTFLSGIEVVVAPNTTTTFWAATIDPGGSRACSTTYAVYTVDATPPPPPVFAGTDPASPANNTRPHVKGGAEPLSIVRLYANPACTGVPVAQGTAADFAAPGLELTLADDTSITLYANATDALGNRSGCSAASITYVEDSTSPETTIVSGPPATIAAGTAARFGFSSSDAVSSFQCRVDSAPFEPCTSPQTVMATATGAHRFDVRAVDRAGNADPTPAARAYTVAGTTGSSPSPAARDCNGRAARVGTANDDKLRGTSAADNLLGGDGADLMRSFGGSDCMDGEAGDDSLYGGGGADNLIGGRGGDLLEGEAGNDRMTGGAGNDFLTDHIGRDLFSGGAGNDTIDARDKSALGRRVRDVVRCGGGARDIAVVDRRDRVSPDCERVRRR